MVGGHFGKATPAFGRAVAEERGVKVGHELPAFDGKPFLQVLRQVKLQCAVVGGDNKMEQRAQ